MVQPMGWCCWEEMGSCCWTGERQPAVSTQKEKGPAVERSLETKLARTLETLEDGATEGKRRERERWRVREQASTSKGLKGPSRVWRRGLCTLWRSANQARPNSKQQHRPTTTVSTDKGGGQDDGARGRQRSSYKGRLARVR